MKQNNKITLTIASTSGGEFEDEFSVRLKVGPLKVRAMSKLGLDPSKAEDYNLLYKGNPLDEKKTLKELDIPDGATLLLEPRSPEVI